MMLYHGCASEMWKVPRKNLQFAEMVTGSTLSSLGIRHAKIASSKPPLGNSRRCLLYLYAVECADLVVQAGQGEVFRVQVARDARRTLEPWKKACSDFCTLIRQWPELQMSRVLMPSMPHLGLAPQLNPRFSAGISQGSWLYRKVVLRWREAR